MRKLITTSLLLFYLGTITGQGSILGNPLPASLEVVLMDAGGQPVAGAGVELVKTNATSSQEIPLREFRGITNAGGRLVFADLPSGNYGVSVHWHGQTAVLKRSLELGEGSRAQLSLELSADRQEISLSAQGAPSPRPARAKADQENNTTAVTGSGSGELSGKQVSSLPLNKRDFTQLLQLVAGTTKDTNGAANFTQQFAINGQRATTAVFAMDGVDITDPEMGGATFANFNVDAIENIRSDSGVMPASEGEGAAGFTNVITKSGAKQVHGSIFEFARNAAFDARNLFDRRSFINPGRIPPFVRNEFGFTNGGPVVLPGAYDGRQRTFYFLQYEGFRQVLGTTQTLSVPTLPERQGIDTTTFPGDALLVPVSPEIAPVLAGYPLPNDPQGPYGARSFATSSKVSTSSNQFSARIDHRISDRASMFVRFNFNNVVGPTTNPNQTAINPSFALRFLDHQRNLALNYTRTVSNNFVSESSLGFIRSTPLFTTVNRVQPGLLFADGLYEPFNSASGANFGDWGNLLQARQSFTWTHGTHSVKMGFEARFDRDTTIFALGSNGTYTFGGGTAYSPVAIHSASGMHDIHPGDPLPDALTGFLTASPFSFTASVAGPRFPQGDRTGDAAVRREAYNAYFQDTWKISPRVILSYGLRYEVNARIHEAHHLTSGPFIVGPGGQPARYWDAGAHQKLLVNPQPPYLMDWWGWGPRFSAEWRATDHTTLRAGAAITTLLPNLFMDDGVTGGIPYVLNPYLTAVPGGPVPMTNTVAPFYPPPIFTPQGQLVFATSRTTDVPPNTEVDLQRLENDLAVLSPGHQVQALSIFANARNFQNGYIETYTGGFDHDFGEVKFNASYVGTAGVKLVGFIFPNNYAGADPAFAPFTRFDSTGHVLGGIGPEFLIGNPSHSTFHSVETAVSKTSARFGLGFQASYTFSKSIDNASTPAVGFFGPASSATVLQGAPQDPRNPGTEKGPSTFDLTHILAFSFVQVLPFDRLALFQPLGRRITAGWQLLNVSVLTSGPPFSVFSGVQQTGVGSNDADRPDQVGRPLLSTSHTVREDYFGLGSSNASLFVIPIDVPGGTGPNHGRFGRLGRDTFRGPGFRNLDISLMKDTPILTRGGSEPLTLEFRAEFFNVFNLVNFGLPANIVRGSGFGLISRTAGPSRQLQFSLKLLY
jgi:hypothetical protein